MERLEILRAISSNLEEAQYMLLALSKYEQKHGKSPTKSELGEETNKLYRAAMKAGAIRGEEEDLIRSRHMLDVFCAKLHGGGLADVQKLGRIRVYQLSKFGKEMLQFMKTKGGAR